MKFYPAYRVRDVLDEYAITFFTMLNHGYRDQHRNYLMLARISLLPHVKKDARTKFIKTLEYASKDPADILRLGNNGQATDMNKVKKVLGG